MADKKKANLKDIKLLVLDVDGVMTDGTIIIVNGTSSSGKTRTGGASRRKSPTMGLSIRWNCSPVR